MINKQKCNRKQKNWLNVLALIAVIGGLSLVADDGLIPVANAEDDLVYVPLDSPCRVVNTRQTGSQNLIAASSRDFLSFGSAGGLDSQGGNPAGCDHPRSSEGMQPAAIAANVTAVGKKASGNGNIVAYPAGSVAPGASLVNYTTAANIANSTIISLRTSDGSFTLLSNNSDVPAIVDVVGYFYPTSGGVQQVDCSADADALLNATIKDDTTYNITGACDGPIYITTDGTWFVGDGVSTSSIVLPFDTTSPDTGAVTVSGGSDVRFQDLTFDVSAWSGLSAEGSDAGGVYARDAFVTLTDVNVTGGLWGINPYRNAIIRLEGTINVTNFVNEGITLGDQSTVQVRGSSTTVTVNTSNLASQSFTNGNYITGISAYRQGVLEVRGNLSVSVPSGKSALSVSDNSQIRVRSPAIGTFNGPIDISNSSVANLSNTVVNGRIHVNGGSTLDFKNSQKDSTNDIQAADNSTINISSGSIINDQLTALRSSVINVDSSTVNDDLYAQDGSVINLGNVGLNNSNIELFTNSVIRTSGTTVITAQTVNVSGGAYLEFNDSTTLTFPGNINLTSGGILYAEGDANLGNAPIQCASREMQVVISTAGSNNVSGVVYGTCP